jgi:hypothetical protein
MTNYNALRAELLKARTPAVVDGVFTGSMRQMLACTAAVRVRNALEEIHEGLEAPEETLVCWPGGSCALHDAAALSPAWAASFARQMSDQIAGDIARFEAALRSQDRETVGEMLRALAYCQKWVLPRVSDGDISAQLPRAEAASFRPSRSLRSPVQRLRSYKIAEADIFSFLLPWTQGNPAPALAAETGQSVTISMNGQAIPWCNLGHLGDFDMMRFNIEISDAIYLGLRAIDQARNWDSEEVSVDFQI